MSATGVAGRLESIRSKSGIVGSDVAKLLNTTPQTVSRWQTGKGMPRRDKLEELLHLEWLADQLSEFYTPQDAKLWLLSPHRLLEGETPADRIRAGRLDDVLALIGQLRDGAYV